MRRPTVWVLFHDDSRPWSKLCIRSKKSWQLRYAMFDWVTYMCESTDKDALVQLAKLGNSSN